MSIHRVAEVVIAGAGMAGIRPPINWPCGGRRRRDRRSARAAVADQPQGHRGVSQLLAGT